LPGSAVVKGKRPDCALRAVMRTARNIYMKQAFQACRLASPQARFPSRSHPSGFQAFLLSAFRISAFLQAGLDLPQGP